MRDRVFFPLIVIIAGVMIFFALRPGAETLPSGPWSGGGSDYTRLTLEGEQLARIVAGGDVNIDMLGDGDGASLQIEALAGMLSDNPERGPHYRIAPDLEHVFSGSKLKVTVRARPGEMRGAQQFEVNYSAGNAGNSGWKSFDLGLEAKDFTFEYNVPVHLGEAAFDYVGIRPVVPDKTRTLIIESITLQRGERWVEDNS